MELISSYPLKTRLAMVPPASSTYITCLTTWVFEFKNCATKRREIEGQDLLAQKPYSILLPSQDWPPWPFWPWSSHVMQCCDFYTTRGYFILLLISREKVSSWQGNLRGLGEANNSSGDEILSWSSSSNLEVRDYKAEKWTPCLCGQSLIWAENMGQAADTKGCI